MKKISFIAMALCLCASVFAYEQIGQLNPYAYGVSAQAKNGKIAVSYQLNAPATATEIAIYCDGVEVGTQVVEDNAKGLHSAVVDLAAYNAGGTYTVGIRVHGNSYEAPFQLKEIVDGSTDTTALNYAFYHPKGVAVDRNPFSANFGRILTAEAMMATPDDGYHSSTDKDGIYAFDATFTPIANGNNMAFKGGLEFAKKMSDGATNAYTPYRIVISKDGRIFASMFDDTRSPIYEISADLQTWTPIFTGAMTNGVLLDGEGKFVCGINCGLDVRGEGEDLELIALSVNANGFSSYSGDDFMVATYKLGTATSWTGAATTADTLSKIVGDAVVPVAANCGICYDETDGYWYIGNRALAVDQKALCHVNANKVVDWELHATEADSTLMGLNGNGFNGGGQARVIDGMLFVGQGQKASGTGNLNVYDIAADAATGAPVLTRKYQLNLIGISRNLNDFAVDFGHNLFTVGNSNEKIVPVALPYSGVVETPVAAEVVKEGSAVENIEAAPVVEKFIENGQVVIVKDGVRYNALGARL